MLWWLFVYLFVFPSSPLITKQGNCRGKIIKSQSQTYLIFKRFVLNSSGHCCANDSLAAYRGALHQAWMTWKPKLNKTLKLKRWVSCLVEFIYSLSNSVRKWIDWSNTMVIGTPKMLRWHKVLLKWKSIAKRYKICFYGLCVFFIEDSLVQTNSFSVISHFPLTICIDLVLLLIDY